MSMPSGPEFINQLHPTLKRLMLEGITLEEHAAFKAGILFSQLPLKDKVMLNTLFDLILALEQLQVGNPACLPKITEFMAAHSDSNIKPEDLVVFMAAAEELDATQVRLEATRQSAIKSDVFVRRVLLVLSLTGGVAACFLWQFPIFWSVWGALLVFPIYAIWRNWVMRGKIKEASAATAEAMKTHTVARARVVAELQKLCVLHAQQVAARI